MTDGVLRVVQLNAGSLLEPGWPERRVELVAWLRRLQADVVCLEEIWEDARSTNSAEWIVEQLPEFGYHHVFGGDSFGTMLWHDSSLRFGSAVLSRWPIDSVRHVRLPVEPGDDWVAAVPWELVHATTAGLDVLACHLAAAPTHGLHRRCQVLAIVDYIKSIRGDADAIPSPGTLRDAMPVVLCGDFNAEPDSDEIRFLCSLTPLDGTTTFFQDSWRVAGEGPGYTQDWRGNALAAGMNINRKRIDYIFVGDPYQRRGGAGRVLSASLAFHEPLTGVCASDHFGVVADIVWPDRPSDGGR